MQSVQRCLNLLFQRNLFLIFFLFKKYLEPKNGKQCCLPPLYVKSNLKDTFFSYSFKLLRVLSLSICWIISNLYIPPCVGNFFSIYGVNIPRKRIESMHFYSYPSSRLKTPGRTFWKSVPPNTKWVGKTKICFIKIQS